MTDLASQASSFLNLYWEDVLLVIGVAGALVIRRELKKVKRRSTEPAVVPSATPFSGTTSIPPDGPSLGAILLAASSAAAISPSHLTDAEDAELRGAVPPTYEVSHPLPTPAPIPLPPMHAPTKADTQVSAKAQGPTTPDEKVTTADTLRLLLGSGSR